MVLSLRAAKSTNFPHTKPLPVDVAGQPLQVFLGLFTNDASLIIGFEQGVDQFDLIGARALFDLLRGDTPILQVPIDPRHEEEIARARLDGAGTWEEQVGESIAHAAQP